MKELLDCFSMMSGIRFGIYSDQAIRAISVKHISSPLTFDDLQHPVPKGLYDPALGPIRIAEQCATCTLSELHCPGHFGHISLPVPVYNPLLFDYLLQILKASCWSCHRLYLNGDDVEVKVFLAQMEALRSCAPLVAESLKDLSRPRLKIPLNDLAEESAEMTYFDRVNSAAMIDEQINQLMAEIPKDAEPMDDRTPSTKNFVKIQKEVFTDFLKNVLLKKHRKCPQCSAPVPSLRHENKRSILAKFGVEKSKRPFIRQSLKTKNKNSMVDVQVDGAPPDVMNIFEDVQETIGGFQFLAPCQVMDHLRQVWWNGGEKILASTFPFLCDDGEPKSDQAAPTDLLFCTCLLVSPSKFRPLSMFMGRQFENPRTLTLRRVLDNASLMKRLLQIYALPNDKLTDSDRLFLDQVSGETPTSKYARLYTMLQSSVNVLYDSDMDRFLNRMSQSAGIRQILERKEGLFRKHMMGKRVNYAARSVITPDPYMDVDGVGVPEVFAKKLTYPESVFFANVDQLRTVVKNGSYVHPGACFVVDNGHKLSLNVQSVRERTGIAKRLYSNKKLLAPKTVFRHLKNDDMILANRQPTLHKPSIMAHRTHVLKGQKTIRLNYATCKTYNADFDGDEMNLHFPQNEIARAEAVEIVCVPNQYLVPKDGTPISGLIQDHVISGFLLTLPDKFLSKEDYNYLVLSAFGLYGKKLRRLPPAVLKPVRRWTGKQVISTVLINVLPKDCPLLNMKGSAKVSLQSWQVRGHKVPEFDLSESCVFIRGAELMCGVLDKAQYGASSNGLVHCVYELYGPRVACHLLSCFSRLFTTYLQIHGFSLGIEDVLTSAKADNIRRETIEKLNRCGDQVVKDAFSLADDDEATLRNALSAIRSKDNPENDMKHLDYCMKMATDKLNNVVNRITLPHGLLKPFLANSLQMMIQSGSKGTTVNSVQMSCMLGQIELEGCRVRPSVSGRTLPSFKKFDTSPRAGGFVVQRFLSGLAPQEFFFHCIAGREGLIDTAVKTSRSGYLQRCLIKHLESLVVNYDLTVRDADSSVIQFQYGEDGFDVCKAQFLQRKSFPFLLDNINVLRQSKVVQGIQVVSDVASKQLFKKIRHWKKKHGEAPPKHLSPFAAFSKRFDDCEKQRIIDTWLVLREDEKRSFSKHACKPCPDPVLSMLNPATNLGALSESLLTDLDSFVRARKVDKRMDDFQKLMYAKALWSLADPGESVGLLAAQSIGEPSTQMTLNTFHFAGRGEMNVTLGIPRLREILMTGSENIATPTMQAPFHSHVSREAAEDLQRKMNTVYLQEVLESFSIEEVVQVSDAAYREYTVLISILKPSKRSLATRHIRCQTVLRRIERTLFKRIAGHARKLCNAAYKLAKQKASEAGPDEEVDDAEQWNGVTSGSPNESGEEMSTADDVDADAAETRRKERHSDENEYLGEDEERGEVAVSDRESETEDFLPAEALAPNSVADIIKFTMDETAVNTEAAHVESQRIRNVLESDAWISHYSYDLKHNRWCKAGLRVPMIYGTVDMRFIVKEEMQKLVVQSVPNVQRCILSEDADKTLILKAEGINFEALLDHADLLDVNRVYCNDIHKIEKMYGIEAARIALVKETEMVFGSYGIHVDYRHLSLLSDYLTHTGTYRAFNRHHMALSSSPLQKMTFETTTNFLKDSLLLDQKDYVQTPSATLVTGKLAKCGTGSFDLLFAIN